LPPRKNRLTSTDEKLLEDAFERRLTALPPPDEPSLSGDPASDEFAVPLCRIHHRWFTA
jgi:hypothetical protein